MHYRAIARFARFVYIINMKNIRQYAVAVLIALTSLLVGCTQAPVERVAAQFCKPDGTTCYMQDVPAAQFIGKPYTIVTSVFDSCTFTNTCPSTVQVGNRSYRMNQSEVSK